MKTQIYCNISALVFAIVAIAHLLRIIFDWSVVINNIDITLSISIIAFILTSGLAYLGFTIGRNI